jgi:hypothetical protein
MESIFYAKQGGSRDEKFPCPAVVLDVSFRKGSVSGRSVFLS